MAAVSVSAAAGGASATHADAHAALLLACTAAASGAWLRSAVTAQRYPLSCSCSRITS